MTPTYEIAEWAEELGIKGAKDRAWEWLGDFMVPNKNFDFLAFACGCRANNPVLGRSDGCPHGPGYERIEMQRLGESEYLVGQCKHCSKIIWARAEVA